MEQPTDLMIIPQGGFGIMFLSGSTCGNARIGVGINYKIDPRSWTGSSVLTNEDVRRLRDFLTSHLEWIDSKTER